MTVAQTFRRKTKINAMITKRSVSSMVNCTSRYDSRIVSERVVEHIHVDARRQLELELRHQRLTASATAIVFVPGWRWIPSVIARCSHFVRVEPRSPCAASSTPP